MLSPKWNLIAIQADSIRAFYKCQEMVSIVFAPVPEPLTPRMMLDSFYELQFVYEELKESMLLIEDSLANGHDPDRSI
jgi:hypothetical protein